MSVVESVNVSCTILNAQGAPVSGANLVFQLLRTVPTDLGVALSTRVEATTNSSGQATVLLYTYEFISSPYDVYVSTSDGEYTSRGTAYVLSYDCTLDQIFQPDGNPSVSLMESNVLACQHYASNAAISAASIGNVVATAVAAASNASISAASSASTASASAAAALAYQGSASTSAASAASSASTASTQAASASSSASTASSSASSASASAATATTQAGLAGAYQYREGNCKLTASGSILSLMPYDGVFLPINGVVHSIPSVGVALSISGLTAYTIYYIYAYIRGSTIVLEASTTTYAQNSTTGIQQKSGDATRTLVGMIRTNGSGGITNSPGNVNVLSWFNRTMLYATVSLGSLTTTATTSTQLSSTYLDSICWPDETILAGFFSSRLYNSTASDSATVTLCSNGAAVATQTSVDASGYMGQGAFTSIGLPRATHSTLTLWGSTASGGTMNIEGSGIFAWIKG